MPATDSKPFAAVAVALAFVINAAAADAPDTSKPEPKTQADRPAPAGAPAAASVEPRTPRPQRPIVLGPDDKPAVPDPPAGFNARREGIPHGLSEMIEYDSKTVGTRRKMLVYTPPKGAPGTKCPVLYLLHGIGGDETEWQRFGDPADILDNLIAEGKAVPMIGVMPNGRAQKNDRAEGDVFKSAPAFATFERDLVDDVIPAIESRYAVHADRDHRALAGLSMGGGENHIPHVWHVDGNAHDPPEWRNNLYWFSQRLFR